MALPIPRRRFTVDEYYRMAEAGIFSEDDRVELIDGEIVELVPIGDLHVGTVNRFTHLFVGRLGDVAVVSVQNPVRLGQYDEPMPDLALLLPRPDFYGSAKPTPSDVLLLVEVADTSLAFDRRVKLPLYAHHGIPEVWVVNLRQRVILVYRQPGPAGYGDSRTARIGETIVPLAFPDREFRVADILGS